MDTNIISEYLKHIKRELLNFYKIMLGNDYQKQLVEPFLDSYFKIRYENEIDSKKKQDAVELIGEELKKVYDELYTKKNEEVLKNIYSLFGYILYFDEVLEAEDEKPILDSLFDDFDLRITITNEMKEELIKWFRYMGIYKFLFKNALDTKEFSLEEKRLRKGLYELSLNEHVKISYLYSQEAINRAYRSTVVYEDSLFVLYIKASEKVLENAKNLDFSRTYLVDFADSLFDKPKKSKQLLNVIDNTLAKKYIHINLKYCDYVAHKEMIRKLIQDGYQFTVLIDETYEGDISTLFLFSIIFIYENDEFSDMILTNKNKIPGKIICL